MPFYFRLVAMRLIMFSGHLTLNTNYQFTQLLLGLMRCDLWSDWGQLTTDYVAVLLASVAEPSRALSCLAPESP